MIYLTNLLNFKSYSDIIFKPSLGLNLISGINGSGKTNLLDALYLSCLGKNIRNLPDSLLVKQDEASYMVSVRFQEPDEQVLVSIGYQMGEKRKFFLNKEPLGKLADYVGRFPVIFFSPDDAYHLLETSEERRKLINNTLCQAYPAYLELLNQYTYHLEQRNALLKQFADRNYQDTTLLALYTEPMVGLCEQIYTFRNEAIAQWVPLVQALYTTLSGSDEIIDLHYESAIAHTPAAQLFQEAIYSDLAAKRCTVGIHKDDLLLSIQNLPLKKSGSQGQIKTYIISLKLVLAKWLEQVKGRLPILLLDDIFDKLDDGRIANLITWLDAQPNQIFLTDARPERSLQLFNNVARPFAAWKVENGAINPFTSA
jgi:DNA replication and repair protein RecF